MTDALLGAACSWRRAASGFNYDSSGTSWREPLVGVRILQHPISDIPEPGLSGPGSEFCALETLATLEDPTGDRGLGFAQSVDGLTSSAFAFSSGSGPIFGRSADTPS